MLGSDPAAHVQEVLKTGMCMQQFASVKEAGSWMLRASKQQPNAKRPRTEIEPTVLFTVEDDDEYIIAIKHFPSVQSLSTWETPDGMECRI